MVSFPNLSQFFPEKIDRLKQRNEIFRYFVYMYSREQ
jgi:hypothetical protein